MKLADFRCWHKANITRLSSLSAFGGKADMAQALVNVSF